MNVTAPNANSVALGRLVWLVYLKRGIDPLLATS